MKQINLLKALKYAEMLCPIKPAYVLTTCAQGFIPHNNIFENQSSVNYTSTLQIECLFNSFSLSYFIYNNKLIQNAIYSAQELSLKIDFKNQIR